MVAPFIIVTAITEQKLPRSKYLSVYMIVAVDGLCPGGNIDPRNEAVIYPTFIRTEKGGVNNTTSEHKHWFRKNALLPFVTIYRTSYYEHAKNLPIPEKLTSVCWCDGGQTQLNSIAGKSN